LARVGRSFCDGDHPAEHRIGPGVRIRLNTFAADALVCANTYFGIPTIGPKCMIGCGLLVEIGRMGLQPRILPGAQQMGQSSICVQQLLFGRFKFSI
jgi:hypothetical protein